nr:MAG TPA: hypothetical protein [Caudoviricetes sp.]
MCCVVCGIIGVPLNTRGDFGVVLKGPNGYVKINIQK